ncbi:melanoma-associated antigen B2-like [Tamandua tetradactyla]|uniref:melanoma-associated antigen B2-like n=1 Tax=Tamandua tetradactyla TaxID=48850 RepID=UPI0040541D02
MPRGQKSKLRSRDKRRQARGEPQGLKGAQATVVADKEAPCCSSLVLGDSPEGSPAAVLSEEPRRPPSSPTPASAVSQPRSEKGAEGPEEEQAGSLEALVSGGSYRRDPLTRKAFLLIHFLLDKYRTKQPIVKAEMLKIISRKYNEF